MSMIERLRADLLTARKNRLEPNVGLLTALVGETTAVGKNNGNRETTDEEALAVIRKFLKNGQDTLALIPEANVGARDKAQAEIAILLAYLPQQMSEAEIIAAVNGVLTDLSAPNMGAVMAALKARHGGRYDAKLASGIVKGLLAK